MSVPGFSRWRHPERPVRPGPGHDGDPGSGGPLPAQRGACTQARAGTCGECHVLCDHERPSQPGHPRAGYVPSRRLPVPTQNALTKLPRARAAPPHVPAPHLVTLGLGSQRPLPTGHRRSRTPSSSPYTDTGGLTPAPHKARPRDPASAPHSRSAPAPVRTPARGWVPTPRTALRPGPCPRAGRPAHLGTRSHSGARRPALRLRGPEARAPMGVGRGGRPGGKEGGPRRPLLGPRRGGLPATFAAATVAAAWLCERPVCAQA